MDMKDTQQVWTIGFGDWFVVVGRQQVKEKRLSCLSGLRLIKELDQQQQKVRQVDNKNNEFNFEHIKFESGDLQKWVE